MESKGLSLSILNSPRESYWITRDIFLRALGVIYFFVFFPLLFQFKALLGTEGLLPVTAYLTKIKAQIPWPYWWNFPTLFWFNSSDEFSLFLIIVGLALSLLLIWGRANSIMLFLLWLFQLSFTHVGQDFWGFGWESNLLEIGFLSIFFAPFWGSNHPPSKIIIWLYRWALFRLMLGAGLIKIRGDACWTDLTCLAYHYETQPIPNPLSPFFHFAPLWFHKISVLVNHLVELICPFLLLGTNRIKIFAGICFLMFQLCILLTGNYAWINYLTILMIIPCFDDQFFKKYIKNFRLKEGQKSSCLIQIWSTYLLFILILIKSWNPLLNLLSPRQIMNTSYDQFHLVNSYGVFGSVGKERMELILLGSRDGVDWKEYEFPCKPGDLYKIPCLISPYHYRISWQIWFAAMGEYNQSPWLINLVYKLLKGETIARELLAFDPFRGSKPKFIKIEKYRYRFVPLLERGWYKREKIGTFLPPVSLK